MICLTDVRTDIDELMTCPISGEGQHSFHASCLDQGLRLDSRCPICRRETSQEGIKLTNPSQGTELTVFPPEVRSAAVEEPQMFISDEDREEDSLAWQWNESASSGSEAEDALNVEEETRATL